MKDDEYNKIFDLAYKFFSARKNRQIIARQLKRTIQRVLPSSIGKSQRVEVSEGVWDTILDIVSHISVDPKPSLLRYQTKSAALAKLMGLIIDNQDLRIDSRSRKGLKVKVKKRKDYGASMPELKWQKEKDYTFALKKRILTDKKLPRGVRGEIRSILKVVRTDITRLEGLLKRLEAAKDLLSENTLGLAHACLNTERTFQECLENDLNSLGEVIDISGGWGIWSKEAFFAIAGMLTRGGIKPFTAYKKIAAVLVRAAINPVAPAVNGGPQDEDLLVDRLARQIGQTSKEIKRIDIVPGKRHRLVPTFIRKKK
jgi:hypothetical protein